MIKEEGDIFFRILRYSISADEEFPVNLSEDDWTAIYDTAQKQSLLGILFYGIQKSPQQRPPRKLLLKWYAVSEQIKKRNVMINRVAVNLEKYFLENGFRTCILKGQGNILNYPDPYIRTGGDIDIWVDGGSRKVLKYVRERFTCSLLCYHHVDIGMYQGVEVEVHFCPIFINNLIHNWRIQRWFKEMKEEQFLHRVDLPEGTGQLCAPTNSFNRIYQMAHISLHVFLEGIGLRQFVDYFFLLKQGFTEDEKRADERLLKRFGLYKLTSAVVWVLKEKLGLEEKYMIVPPNEKLGRFLLDEIIQGGNFGQYDQRVQRGGSQFSQNMQRFKRDFRLMWYFPSECLWEPVFRVYHFFWRLAHR